MRILLLTTHLNIGGIGTYTVSLAKALKAKGRDVYVASSGGALVPELKSAGISHIDIDIFTKSELSPKVFRAVFEISKIIKRFNIDIVHSQTRVSQVAGFFASKLSGIPMVTTCHGFFNKNIGRAILACWGEKVIAISGAVEENLVNYFGVDKSRISLIYNGVDTGKFLKDFSKEEKDNLKDKFGIKKDCGVIGMISRFTPDKGHDTLLYAFRGILKDKPNTQMVFVGDGDKKQDIVNLAQKLNLSDSAVFIKPQLDTVEALSVMDIFMFTPARREGLGLALIEALAAGKPVVATNVGGISSVIEDNVNGILTEPSKPELLAEAVLRLLGDETLCARMAASGRETAVRKFSIAEMADKTEGVYKEVLRGVK